MSHKKQQPTAGFFLTAGQLYCILFVDEFQLTALLGPVVQLFEHRFQLLGDGQAEVGGGSQADAERALLMDVRTYMP